MGGCFKGCCKKRLAAVGIAVELQFLGTNRLGAGGRWGRWAGLAITTKRGLPLSPPPPRHLCTGCMALQRDWGSRAHWMPWGMKLLRRPLPLLPLTLDSSPGGGGPAAKGHRNPSMPHVCPQQRQLLRVRRCTRR